MFCAVTPPATAAGIVYPCTVNSMSVSPLFFSMIQPWVKLPSAAATRPRHEPAIPSSV